MSVIEHFWYRLRPVHLLLIPLSLLFGAVVWVRRTLYARGILRSERLTVPVIVVGNITVGGTGKTPLVLWLAALLQAEGRRPGIVTRGYGGTQRVQEVPPDSDPAHLRPPGRETLITDADHASGTARIAQITRLGGRAHRGQRAGRRAAHHARADPRGRADAGAACIPVRPRGANRPKDMRVRSRTA